MRGKLASEYLLDSIDNGLDYYKNSLEEKEALKFCKIYSRERKWCQENDLDFRELEEEKLFQEYMEKFQFKAKRENLLAKAEVFKSITMEDQNKR